MENFNNTPVFSGTKNEILAQREALINSSSGGAALTQTKTNFVTAVTVQVPRKIEEVAEKVISEARLAGSSFFYGWNVKTKDGKTKRIEGESVDLALSFIRNYQNCASDIEIIEETPTHWTLKSYVIDLETGFTYSRLFRQRKGQNVSKKMGADRAEDMVFQIGQSKAQRNSFLRLMPVWLKKKAIEAAKDAERAGIQDIDIAKEKAVAYFKKLSISKEQLESYLDKAINLWNLDDIVELRSLVTALEENRVTIDEVFGEDEDSNKKESKEEKKGALKETAETKPKSDSGKKDPKSDSPGTGKESTSEDGLDYYMKHEEAIFKQAVKNTGIGPEVTSIEDKGELLLECDRIKKAVQEKKNKLATPESTAKYGEELTEKGKEKNGKKPGSNPEVSPYDELRELLKSDRQGVSRVKKSLKITKPSLTEEEAKKIVDEYKKSTK